MQTDFPGGKIQYVLLVIFFEDALQLMHVFCSVTLSLACRLCYLFCRATRAVSVCPPAYYAHLAAFRQRELCQMSDSSASDTESTMSGTGADAAVEFATCHKDLGATMYYV